MPRPEKLQFFITDYEMQKICLPVISDIFLSKIFVFPLGKNRRKENNKIQCFPVLHFMNGNNFLAGAP